jgi:hypothetical protein
MQWLEAWASTPGAVIASLVIGIIGTLVGVVGVSVAIRARKGKAPTYAMRSFAVIDKKDILPLNDIDILYRKEPIERFTISDMQSQFPPCLPIRGGGAWVSNPPRTPLDAPQRF